MAAFSSACLVELSGCSAAARGALAREGLRDAGESVTALAEPSEFRPGASCCEVTARGAVLIRDGKRLSTRSLAEQAASRALRHKTAAKRVVVTVAVVLRSPSRVTQASRIGWRYPSAAMQIELCPGRAQPVNSETVD